ncbi:hypothetical protein VZ94_08755 [Methylocucumis oryzae]|uniref:Sulfotransferase domain-containing protein n=2 Tax=Methylocucumis oryzae TaxID=1632867 RepID=A0A0F3IJX4_9GAMM|nr:hypothetical protein VZ94_08755 [Methylocucumis oryzae]
MLSNLLKHHPKILSISEFFSFVTDLGSLIDEAFPADAISAEQFWKILDNRYAKQNLMLRHGIAMQEVLYPYQDPNAYFNADSGVPAIAQTTLPFLTPDHDALYFRLRDYVHTLPTANIGTHYQNVFDWLTETFACHLWVERSGGTLRCIKELLTTFPNARFIHIVRDGRDCAISMSQHYGFRMVVIAFALTGMLSVDPFEDSTRSEIEDVTDEYYPFLPEHFDVEAFKAFHKPPSFYARYWSSEIRNNLIYLQELPKERVLTMRYEDFLQQPKESCYQLLNFIDPTLIDQDWLNQASQQIRQPTQSHTNLSEQELSRLTLACQAGLDVLMNAYPELNWAAI